MRERERVGRKLKAANSILHLKINVNLLNGSVCEILSLTIWSLLTERCRGIWHNYKRILTHIYIVLHILRNTVANGYSEREFHLLRLCVCIQCIPYSILILPKIFRSPMFLFPKMCAIYIKVKLCGNAVYIYIIYISV